MAGTGGVPPNRDDDSRRRLRFLRKNARSYQKGLQEGYRIATESQLHVDQSLTWAIGLMGAGIAGAVTTIKAVCDAPPGWLLLVATVPWGLGITAAIVGRMTFVKNHDADSMAYFGKTQKVEALLAQDLDARAFGTNLLAIVQGPLGQRHPLLQALYLVTYLSAAGGLIAAFAAAIYCVKRAASQGGL